MKTIKTLILLSLILSFAGCASTVDYPKIKYANFNQTLLRDCTIYLSKESGIKIELSDEVNKIDDLYVDLTNETKNRSLDKILDDIINFIRKEHKTDLCWKRMKDKILIYREQGGF